LRRRLALAALAVAAIGCGGSDEASSGATDPGTAGKEAHVCTEIGCTSGLFLDIRAVQRKLPRAERVKVCLRERCRVYAVAKTDIVSLTVRGLREGQRVAVRLVAFDRNGEALLRRRTHAPVRKLKPNGPDCPPTCFQVAVRLDPQTLRLVTD
jgi:hypothetical protein